MKNVTFRVPTAPRHPVSALAALLAASLLLACGGEDSTATDPGTVGQAVTSSGGAATALTAPLLPDLHTMAAQKSMTSAEAVGALKKTMKGSGCVTSPACLSVVWSGGLSGQVTFNQCVLSVGNITVNGTMGLKLVLKPSPVLTLTFTQLTVGGVEVNGSARVVPTAKGAATATVDASIKGDAGSLSLNKATVAFTQQNAVLNGPGHVTVAKMDTDFTATTLTWLKGECLPSSGTVDYTEGGSTVVITFLATTPQTGKVSVKVGDKPAATLPLFPACPGK